MTLPLGTIYQKIGDAVTASIHENWKSARVTFEFSDDVFLIQGRYLPKSGEEERSFVVNKTVITLFQNLHAQMAQTPKGNWSRAEFKLQDDGKFEMNFKY